MKKTLIVTAVLAVAASSVGLRTLIVEVEGKGGMASMFDSQGLRYDEAALVEAAEGHAGVRARTVGHDEQEGNPQADGACGRGCSDHPGSG